VVGGGDAAVEEADFLTRYASKVYLIHRRHEFRASKILQRQVFDNPKIEVIWDTVAEKVEGDAQTGMTGLRIHNLVTQKRALLDVTGLFVFVGFRPNTGVIAGHFEHDIMGYVLTDSAMMSSIPGLFIAGDLRAQLTRQVTTASGDATTAAIAADKYITRFKEMERSTSPDDATREALQSSHISAGGYT
jgi:thioredoxin reductase (NADPH)